MLVSKFALIAALALTAAAYPAGRPDASNFDASMSLRPGANSGQTSEQYGSSQSSPQALRRPSRQPSKRHDSHPPQGPPSSPSSGDPSKPDRTRPSYGDRPDSSGTPDRNQPGRTQGDHHGHDHLRDHDKPGKEGKKGKDRPSGHPSRPDEASPTSKPSDIATPTLMPSKSAESVTSSGATPTASLKHETSAGPAY